jgi:tRNA-Thr(GGU) m(6)t(6)A37 methyltransferase TsaA
MLGGQVSGAGAVGGGSMASMDPIVPVPVIGIVRTACTGLESTPIQASVNRAEHGSIEIAEPYRDGLEGLEDFDYAWLLTWLHRPDQQRPDEPAGHPPLRQVPFLLRSQQRAMGIFATRGPRRVNPIGLSLIQLLEVTGEIVRFAGVDVIDGTPVVDLKPYVTRFDRPPGDPRCGWFDQIAIAEGTTPARLARGEED